MTEKAVKGAYLQPLVFSMPVRPEDLLRAFRAMDVTGRGCRRYTCLSESGQGFIFGPRRKSNAGTDGPREEPEAPDWGSAQPLVFGSAMAGERGSVPVRRLSETQQITVRGCRRRCLHRHRSAALSRWSRVPAGVPPP